MKSPAVSLLLAAALAAGCDTAPRTVTIASTWQMVGSTVSVAAWSKDSAALQSAIARMRDATRSADTTAMRSAVRQAWAAERGELSSHLEWRDVVDSYVLDQALPVLGASADSALIDLGGLFLWLGPPTRRPVGITDPGNALDPVARVELRTGAVSTVSGRSEERSITVLAPTRRLGTPWASALFALGCDRALALAARRNVNLVCADSVGVRWSSELQNRVSLPPGRGP